MSKQQVRFKKGNITDYNKDKMQGMIYFAEDKKKIIVDGIEYDLDLESDEVDLISNIEHKDNKLTIIFSNGKTLELVEHYWEEIELPSLEKSFPMGGCVISTHPIKKFSFQGGSGKWYSSDGQEGEYNNTDLTTITFKEEGEYTIKFVNSSADRYNRLGFDINFKSVLMIGESNGETYGIIPVNNNGNAKLILYNNITSIEEWAFASCSGFTGDLIIPDSVTSIGNHAFRICKGFTSLKLPESLTSIGSYAFLNCSSLSGELIIPENVTSIGNDAFQGCSGFTGDLIIPESVTSIESSAFWNCSGFTSLKLPDSVTSIESSAFWNCSGFTSLKLPDSVTSIGSDAFQGCSGFTGDLIIPESVTSIESSAFQSCIGLSKIYVCEDTKLGEGWNIYTTAEVIKYKKGEKPWL